MYCPSTGRWQTVRDQQDIKITTSRTEPQTTVHGVPFAEVCTQQKLRWLSYKTCLLVCTSWIVHLFNQYRHAHHIPCKHRTISPHDAEMLELIRRDACSPGSSCYWCLTHVASTPDPLQVRVLVLQEDAVCAHSQSLVSHSATSAHPCLLFGP